MPTNAEFDMLRRRKANWVFGGALLIFLWRFVSDALVSQMAQPFFIGRETEFIYKQFTEHGLAFILTQLPLVATLFDLLLFGLPLLYLMFWKRGLAIAFTVVTLIYFLTYNIVSAHHYHGLVGLLVISIPFWFDSQKRFNFSWEAARYYLLFIFSSAALWKILRGSAFNAEQLSNILMKDQLYLLLQQPESWQGQLSSYLITHSSVSHFLLLATVLLQLCFLIGFFTKRFDRALLGIAILFCILNYLVMHIASFELLILGVTLWLPVRAASDRPAPVPPSPQQ